MSAGVYMLFQVTGVQERREFQHVRVRGFIHVKIEIASYDDIGRNDNDLLEEGGEFFKENG